MIVSKMIQKEFTRNFIVALLVLTGASLSIMTIKALEMTSSGTLDPKDVLTYSLLLALRQLPIILCISLLISIVSGLSRLGNDSEMIVLNTTGWGPVNTLTSVLKFSLPITACVFLLAIFIWPIGSQSLQDIRDSFSSKAEHEKVTPGVFTSNKSKNQIVFVGVNSDTDLHDIFLYKQGLNNNNFTKSESGRIVSIESTPWIFIDKGNSVKITNNDNTYTITNFSSAKFELAAKHDLYSHENQPNIKSTLDLINNPSPPNLSELSWRIGLIIASFNLSLAGILFPTSNQRLGKSGNFIFALFTFIVYMNLIILGQRYIQTNKFSFLEYNAMLHLTFFTIAALCISRLQFRIR